jgi:homoserine O-succinyltransferase/O-acetyltransferase
LREHAMWDRSVELLANFSHSDIAGRLTDRWRPAATRVYRNWLLYLSAQKAQRLEHTRVGFGS